MILWAEHGLRNIERNCRRAEWCNEKYGLIEQGMGIFGNALTLCSFLKKGYVVAPEPVVKYKKKECPIGIETFFDVGVLMDNDEQEFIVLLEVKLYKKSRESIPSFPHVDAIYEEFPRPIAILKRCNAVPLGVLLEVNRLPKKTVLPPYIVRVNKVLGRNAPKYIYNEILNWLINKGIIRKKLS